MHWKDFRTNIWVYMHRKWVKQTENLFKLIKTKSTFSKGRRNDFLKRMSRDRFGNTYLRWTKRISSWHVCFIESVFTLLKNKALMLHESICCFHCCITDFREKSEGLIKHLMLFTHISRIRAFGCIVKGA